MTWTVVGALPRAAWASRQSGPKRAASRDGKGQDDADPGAAGVVLPHWPIDVRFEQISFAYPGGPVVLHDVDPSISPGSRVAVIGETGSGKTTFAKLLTRLMDPTAGSVVLAGAEITDALADECES